MIKVLIVDDSKTMQESLTYMLSSDPVFDIVGYASNGQEAIELTEKYRPDLITMDWEMPVLNGYEAAKVIMETNPTPIVVVTGNTAASDMSVSFSMMEAGALAVVKKPHGVKHPSYEWERSELIETLKLMSEIKLVKRIGSGIDRTKKPDQTQTTVKDFAYHLIAIGASTGGPIALLNLLKNLPSALPIPVLVVQHISLGFVKGFVDWLMKATGYPVHIAAAGDLALPGHVYVAPDNQHMAVDAHLRIVLSNAAKENASRPSVSYLFRSCSVNFGRKTIAVILSGMGQDGSAELKLIKDLGGLTYAQDEKSSVVFGMPGEAIRIGGACFVHPPEQIGRCIKNQLITHNLIQRIQ